MDVNPEQRERGGAALLTELARVRRRARGDQRRISLPLLVLGIYAAGLGAVGAATGGLGLGGPQFSYAFCGLHAALAVLAVAHYRRTSRLGAGPRGNPYAVALVAGWLVLSPLVALLCVVAPLGVCAVVLLITAAWVRSRLLVGIAVAVGAAAVVAGSLWPSVGLVEAMAAILLIGSFIAYRRERAS